VRFHLGPDETLGRVVLLDRDELIPGEEALAQIVMEKPVVAYKGDPFVIRYYSPVNTIGGGSIIDPMAPRQKRFKEDVLNDLLVKEEGSLYDIVLHELEASGEEPLTLADLARKTGSEEGKISEEIKQLVEDEKVIDVTGKGNYYLSSTGLQQIYSRMAPTLSEYQQKYPLRGGYPKEDMRSRLFNKINTKVFNAIIKHMEETGLVQVKNNLLASPGFIPAPDETALKHMQQIKAMMTENLFNPPSLEEIREKIHIGDSELNELIAYLLEQGELARINETLYFSAAAIEKGQELLTGYFSREKELSLAALRDLFDTTRKYALPLAEYYDRIRFHAPGRRYTGKRITFPGWQD
jgi:selenocysteine-specific elongation factor